MARPKATAKKVMDTVAAAVEDAAGDAVKAADPVALATSIAVPAVEAAVEVAQTHGVPEPLKRVKRAQLPSAVRFALVAVLSFYLESLGRSLVVEYTHGELAKVARPASSLTQTEALVLAGWKLFGLALGWYGNYDGFDLAALAVLSHGPMAYLTSTYYGIRASTAGAYLAVEVVSTFFPFLLLRKLSGAHAAAPGVPNRDIVVDRQIQVLTSMLSALVYSVTLFLACRTFLPTNFVLYFEGIRTIEPAQDAQLFSFNRPLTQILCLLFGVAARTLIFTPFVTASPTVRDQEVAAFDPATATLGQTIYWNLWGYTTPTKVSVKRTAVAMLFAGVDTYLQATTVLSGVDSYGAAVYASVWTLAAMITGFALRYVGSV
ncbi:hypothetical protein QBC32DRAFT_356332 [Pseudoneurospora amorphoporcata]|uniref:Uncharacterized protein n=1 Tax=Pseudoneurospora amorphoporcata TaxID=241081 RepID=A0AAN6NKL7_9PEZI|nr:hypothetical protein QBC32DRAFT_356332 [Pseudoneurospora amorphoporcata]